MAKGQYHIGKNGPGICNADPSKPGGRACRYESDGHYDDPRDAELIFERKISESAVPESSSRSSSKPVADAEQVLIRKPDESYGADVLQFIRDYRGGANWSINGMLREGKPLFGRYIELVDHFDRVFERVEPLSAPIQLQRSLEASPDGKGYGIPSEGVYSDPAYLSCSSSKDFIERSLEYGVTEDVSAPSDTILTIDVPKGARVFALALDDEDYAEEAEVILPRDSKLEITGDSGFVDGVRRVSARLILEGQS